jgi:hypothetical protein
VLQRSVIVQGGISLPVQEKKHGKRHGNRQLPNGTLNNGLWASIFIPTFLQYVGSTNRDVWALNQHNIIQALQAIWNEVYKGCNWDSRRKIRHVVEVGRAVHEVVSPLLADDSRT